MNGIEMHEKAVKRSEAYREQPTTVYQTVESPEHGSVFYDNTNVNLEQALESGEWISAWVTLDPVEVNEDVA